MIELINVSKYYPTDFGRHYVFRNVNLVIPPDKSVGIMGPNGAGKSTFLRLLGGNDMPSEGKIIKTGLISPPMGLTPGVQPSLTAAENARFAGRLYGLDRDEINELIEYVRDIANIGKYFDMPLGTYSAGMRQRVSFAINMALKYDYYLFDEIGAGGDKEFRRTAREMVKERLATSKFIMSSHDMDELLRLCDSGIVIRDGELSYFDNIRDAVIFYGEAEALKERGGRNARRTAPGESDGSADEASASGGELAADAGPVPESRRDRRERRKLMRAAAGLLRERGQPDNGNLVPAQDGSAAADAAALKQQKMAERRARVEARRAEHLTRLTPQERSERRAAMRARRQQARTGEAALSDNTQSANQPVPGAPVESLSPRTHGAGAGRDGDCPAVSFARGASGAAQGAARGTAQGARGKTGEGGSRRTGGRPGSSRTHERHA